MYLLSCVCVCVSFPSPGSLDGTVRCWDTRSRRFEPIQVLDEARDSVSSLKVAQHELLTGSAQCTCIQTSGSDPHVSAGSDGLSRSQVWIYAVCSLFVHDCLAFRSVDGRVRRYDLRMGQLHVDFISSESSFSHLFNIHNSSNHYCHYESQ